MARKRTYYCVEEMPSYPVNEIRVSERPPADPATRACCHAVRATSRAEAEEAVRDRLTDERFKALEKIDAEAS